MYVCVTAMVRRKKDRWQKYSSRAEKRPKVD
jgi:hypothetical protein